MALNYTWVVFADTAFARTNPDPFQELNGIEGEMLMQGREIEALLTS